MTESPDPTYEPVRSASSQAGTRATTGKPGGFFSSARWNSFGSGSVQLVRFGVSLVLYWILGPERVGVMETALIVVGLLDWFKDFGTGQAVVQAKSLERGFLSTIFYTNLVLATALTLLTWFGASLIAAGFGQPDVAPYLRVLGFSFVITAFGLVQRSLYSREMAFQTLARSNCVNALTYAVSSIAFALAGYGVWSMVWGTLIGYVASNAVLWHESKWRPALRFNVAYLAEIKRFCGGVLGANLVNYILASLDRAIIARFLGAEALGLYSLGQRLMRFPMRAIGQTLLSVMLPTFARLQDDLPQYREKFVRAAAGIALVTTPLMLGLMAVAEPLIRGFMKDEWIPAIPLVVIMAPLGILHAVAMPTSTIYVSLGKTTEQFRWSAVFGAVALAGYFIGLPWGIKGVALASLGINLVLARFYFSIPFRLIGLPVRALVDAVAGILGAGLVMALATFGLRIVLQWAGLDARLVLLACVPFGAACYTALIWRLAPPALADLTRLVLPKLGKARAAASS